MSPPASTTSPSSIALQGRYERPSRSMTAASPSAKRRSGRIIPISPPASTTSRLALYAQGRYEEAGPLFFTAPYRHLREEPRPRSSEYENGPGEL